MGGVRGGRKRKEEKAARLTKGGKQRDKKKPEFPMEFCKTARMGGERECPVGVFQNLDPVQKRRYDLSSKNPTNR